MKTFAAVLAFVPALASGAGATNTYIVDITYSNPANRIVSPGDTATVHIWAQFDDDLFAFSEAGFSVDTDEDAAGSWSDFGRELKGPGTNDGTAVGGDVNGILVGQLHFPLAEIFADTANPIGIWHGTFSTSDLSGHTVSLKTVTTRFYCFLDWDFDGDGIPDGYSDSYLDSVIEGSAEILIGPTPGTAAAVALGALAFGCRRRTANPR